MFLRKKCIESSTDNCAESRVRKALELRESVATVPREGLPELYWELQNFQWPEALCEKPTGWELMTHYDQCLFLVDAMSYIEDRISLKERKRCERARMYDETEAQFNEWWESRFVEAILAIASRI